jgi:hypothetical protein
VTADHWNFVLGAYGLAALVLGLYWRHLCRRERELREIASRISARSAKKPA